MVVVGIPFVLLVVLKVRFCSFVVSVLVQALLLGVARQTAAVVDVAAVVADTAAVDVVFALLLEVVVSVLVDAAAISLPHRTC